MTNEITILPMSEIEKMATAVAKSGMFGVKSIDQAMALMLIAQAEGKHPAIAARDYHIIQNKPTLKADAMLARFQQAGGKVQWTCYTDEKVTGKFSHPQGGDIELTWTIEQARKANLSTKDVWKAYPRAMLRSRVISEAIRTIFPGVAIGVYTPEEMESFASSEMTDVTPAKAVFDTARLRTMFYNQVIKDYNTATNVADLDEIHKGHKPKIDKLAESKNDNDQITYESLRDTFVEIRDGLKGKQLLAQADKGNFETIETEE
jgi:hypothetical protein